MIKTYFLTFLLICKSQSQQVITVSGGEVKGTVLISHNDHPFWAFQGIPYAAPPVGDLRWLPPVPHPGWADTLDGSQAPMMCVQGFPDPENTHDNQEVANIPMIGSEDCLVLNVYTKNTKPSELLPVFVWFHGGGLSTGQGDMHGPQFLIDYDLIIVTVNYRLGPLGQLSLDTGLVSGNQGLRDQSLALHWVQENIRQLGGDRARVTIGGESAGSWSVMHHLLAPSSRGLFSGAIGQSGTTISGLADRCKTREEAFDNGKRFAEEICCYDKDDIWSGESVYNCILGKSTRDIFNAQVSGTFSSRPNIDDISAFDPFLPNYAESLLESGEFYKVPVLWGTNSGEGILNAPDYIKNPESLREEFVDVSYWDETRGPFYIFDRETRLNGSDITTRDIEISRLARQFYFGKEITEDDLKQFINLNSDVQFWFGTDKLINYLSPHVPVFHYILYFQDMFSFTINPNTLGKDLGVGHADDLAYMWDIFSLNMESGLYDIWWSDADKLNSRRMLELWSNFIKYGDPTPAGLESEALQGVEWAPVTQGSHQYLRIDKELSMEMTEDYKQRINFWRNITNTFDLR